MTPIQNIIKDTRTAMEKALESTRREFHTMGQEKLHAFWQSWFAMGWAMLEAGQQAWIAMLQGARVPLIDVHHVLARGMAPVHRKATANARRLSRVTRT